MTELTMIERVARAILNAERGVRGDEPISDESWQTYWLSQGSPAIPSITQMRAMAAIGAMREPTEAMLRTASGSEPGAYSYEERKIDWTTMIDAALAED